MAGWVVPPETQLQRGACEARLGLGAVAGRPGVRRRPPGLDSWRGRAGLPPAANAPPGAHGPGGAGVSPAAAPTPFRPPAPPPGPEAALPPPRAAQGGGVESWRGSRRSRLRTCNLPHCRSGLFPQLRCPLPGGTERAREERQTRAPRVPHPQDAGQAPPLPLGARERPLRGPDPRPPRRTRTHSLRCRPPPPQLCLARLGLRISALPADLSASMAAPAAAATKTPPGKTFRRGRAARGLRAPPLPAPVGTDVRRGGARAGQGPPTAPPTAARPRPRQPGPAPPRAGLALGPL